MGRLTVARKEHLISCGGKGTSHITVLVCAVISGYEPAHGDAQDSELFMVAISSQTAGNYTLRVINNVDLGPLDSSSRS